MADKVNWLTVFQAISGCISLSVFIAVVYYCVCQDAVTPSRAETYSLSSLQRDIRRQLDETLPPTYEEAISNQPDSSQPNSTDRTSDGARNTGRDTVQPDSEHASGSQDQRGESKTSDDKKSQTASGSQNQRGKSKKSDVKKSQTAGGSNFKSVPKDDNMCVLYVDTIENTEGNDSQTIVTHFEFSDSKHNTVKGSKLKQHEAGKEQNTGKGKDTGSSSSSANRNVGKGEKENENDEKYGDKNKKLDTVDSEKCDKKYNPGGELNSGAEKREKCEDDVISIANSESGSVDQYCSAEDISYSSKYDTASGGN